MPGPSIPSLPRLPIPNPWDLLQGAGSRLSPDPRPSTLSRMNAEARRRAVQTAQTPAEAASPETAAPAGRTPSPWNDRITAGISSGQTVPQGDGTVRYFDVTSGDWITFVQDENGDWVGQVPKERGAGGDGSQWARLALEREGFEFDKQKYAQDFEEGRRRFALEFDEGQFRDRRDFEATREQFAKQFAESARQFDIQEGRLQRGQEMEAEQFGITEGRLSRQADVQAELGRGGLEVERGRLAQEGELGRGRLAIDRERIAAEKEAQARQAALAENKFRAEVLRNPSDYIYRAFEARGQTAPTSRISHADLLNTVGQYARGGAANDRMMLVGEEGPELIHNPAEAPMQIMPAEQTQRMMPMMRRMGVPGYAGGTVGNPFAGDQVQNEDGGWGWGEGTYSNPSGIQAVPGGVVSPGGGYVPNTGAPEAVQTYAPPPMTVNQTYAPTPYTTTTVNQGSRSLFPGMAPGSRLGPNSYWQQLPTDFNYGPQEAPSAAFGGPVSGPVGRPAQPQYTQDQLIGEARRLSPPGVSAALGGRRIPSWRAATPGLSPSKLGRLSPGELSAMNTRLGVEFNTTLEDELAQLLQLFGPAIQRNRARLV